MLLAPLGWIVGGIYRRATLRGLPRRRRRGPGVVVRLLMKDGRAAKSIEAQVRRALCGVDPIEV